MSAERSAHNFVRAFAAVPGRGPLLEMPGSEQFLERSSSYREALARHLEQVEAALTQIPDPLLDRVWAEIEAQVEKDATAGDVPATGDDAAGDRCGSFLLARGGEPLLPAAIAVARLIEDCGRRPESQPVNTGFTGRLEERWRRRSRLLENGRALLEWLPRHRMHLMQDPEGAASALEREIGRALTHEEQKWLEAERWAATLKFVRSPEKQHNGQIRWFVRQHKTYGYLLDHLGVDGHWVIRGETSAQELLGAAIRLSRPAKARPAPQADLEWKYVRVGDSERPEVLRRPSAEIAAEERGPQATAEFAADQRAARRYAIRADDCEVRLSEMLARGECVIDCVPRNCADPRRLLSFLIYVELVADLYAPELPPPSADEDQAVVLSRALLERLRRDGTRSRRVRIVYVPSELAHPLGGVPEIGAEFISDHLERRGNRATVVQLKRSEFDQRLSVLLGADVVGIGVYVHNRAEVALLVKKLREAGYGGRIVLGGPETRDINSVLLELPGWDAVIRGEAEEAMPEVLDILDTLEQGDWRSALERARLLQGVAIHWGDTLLLCDTASKSRAARISCPLPFNWWSGAQGRRRKMNFTRGCPYQCFFCPNHQGIRIQAGTPDELWTYTLLAIADDLPLPADLAAHISRVLREVFAIPECGDLRIRLHLAMRTAIRREQMECLVALFADFCDRRMYSDREARYALLRAPLPSLLNGKAELSPREAKTMWLEARLALLASLLLWQQEGTTNGVAREIAERAQPRFELETSEDNTLVNRRVIFEYMQRRRETGAHRYFIFNPGQNTVHDLQLGNRKEEPDKGYLDALSWENPFRIALGTDGPSNAVLRQNNKPLYTVAGILRLNRELGRRSIEVANNYILLAPATTLLEAAEALLLFLLLPIPWREYETAINLRVVKEMTTLATDEAILFAPQEEGYNVPFRCPEVRAWLIRWNLESATSTATLHQLIWRILDKDAAIADLIPRIVQQWESCVDEELRELAAIIVSEYASRGSWQKAIRSVYQRVRKEAMSGERTIALFSELRGGSSAMAMSQER